MSFTYGWLPQDILHPLTLSRHKLELLVLASLGVKVVREHRGLGHLASKPGLVHQVRMQRGRGELLRPQVRVLTPLADVRNKSEVSTVLSVTANHRPVLRSRDLPGPIIHYLRSGEGMEGPLHRVLTLARVSGCRNRKGCSFSTSSMQSHTTLARLAVRISWNIPPLYHL